MAGPAACIIGLLAFGALALGPTEIAQAGRSSTHRCGDSYGADNLRVTGMSCSLGRAAAKKVFNFHLQPGEGIRLEVRRTVFFFQGGERARIFFRDESRRGVHGRFVTPAVAMRPTEGPAQAAALPTRPRHSERPCKAVTQAKVTVSAQRVSCRSARKWAKRYVHHGGVPPGWDAISGGSEAEIYPSSQIDCCGASAKHIRLGEIPGVDLRARGPAERWDRRGR